LTSEFGMGSGRSISLQRPAKYYIKLKVAKLSSGSLKSEEKVHPVKLQVNLHWLCQI